VNALRNAEVVAMISERAFIIEAPTASDLAHDGTKPQRRTDSCRAWPAGERMAATVCVGAMLYPGGKSMSVNKPNALAMTSRESRSLQRPHMGA
jgi:hypothetical protein